MTLTALHPDILALADSMTFPDGTVQQYLPQEAIHLLAARYGISHAAVERCALNAEIMPARYARNSKLLSCDDQLRLAGAHVLLVGLGGLGGHVLDMLVRAGVGTITGADGDVFTAGNLNRQILSRESFLHVPKPQAAAEYVASVNSSVTFHGLYEYLSGDGMVAACAGKTVVVDALGGLQYRAELEKAASAADVPLVSAVIAGLSGYVTVVYPGESGPAELLGTGNAAEDMLGTLAPVVACAAAMQTTEVLRIIMGRPRMRGVLFFDLADRSFQNVLFEDM